MTTAEWAANWKAAAEHRDQQWTEERWRNLLHNTQESRRRHLHAAEATRRPAAATSGPGWRLLDRPHEELETFAHNVWDLAFHGIPWPKGWRVRWADLRNGLRSAFGMCVTSAQLVLLDERAQRGRSPKEFLRTVLHELVHVAHPDEDHGPGFEETLKRVGAYVLEPTEPVAAERPHPPEPVKGRRFDGRPVSWPGSGEWEFRG
jgi:hypothetical protein